MTEPANDIDAYLADVPEAHRQTLQRLRVEIRKAVPEATEAISYKIPLSSTGDGRSCTSHRTRITAASIRSPTRCSMPVATRSLDG